MNNFERRNLNKEEAYLISQYEHPITLEINGQKIKIVDISPKELKTPIPTYFAGGFTHSAEDSKEGLIRTAEAGRRIIMPFSSHGVKTEEQFGDLPNAEARKLDLMMKIIEARKIDRINVIATSEGSIYTTAAVLAFPEKFRHIVLVEPAGLSGKVGILELVKRFRENNKIQKKLETHPDKPRGIKDSKFDYNYSIAIRSILSNPSASLKEISAIADSDIVPALAEIHKLGIGVSIIASAEDKVFPSRELQTRVKAGDIDGVYVVWGAHGNYYLYEPYGKAVETALTALEKKYS